MLRFLTCVPLVVAFMVALGALPARGVQADTGDTIALLPFDATQKHEIYGQPVAAELARVLGEGKIDVVLVGRKMAVPERARLIVDGTIASGKGTAIVVTVRIRATADGTVLATMEATAPTLANIDKAAADVSAKTLASIRTLLAATRPSPGNGSGQVTPPVDVRPPATRPKLRPLLFAVTAKTGTDRMSAPLTEAVTRWARTHFREPTPTTGDKLTKQLATQTVKASGLDLAIGFEIVAFSIEMGTIPLVRAKVRVRISDAVGIVFDRVITTDTIVGEKGITADQLAVRAAREVVDIMRPHVKRSVAGWQ